MKPIVWAGYGIRLHGEVKRFRAFLDATGLECVTTWTAADLLPTDHPQNIGIVGVSGQRGANRAVWEAGRIIVLGSSMGLSQTGSVGRETLFAKSHVYHGDSIKFFMESMMGSRGKATPWAVGWRELNPPPLEGSYLFNDTMTRLLPPGAIMVVDGGGTALYTGFQSSHIKEGSRLVCSSAISAMGSGLPEAVGACLAASRRLTTCLIGDGSLMFNLQELATIRHHALPIKVFVLCNEGYLAIRHTQAQFMQGRFHGSGPLDLSFPSLRALASAFHLPYARIDAPYDPELIGEVLDAPGPILCEVPTPADQRMVRAIPGKALSEMEY